MTTLPERIEKRCLNCNALIHGRYCQVCGQENIVHKMTFFGMIKHFVFDLLHFDGKFFTTIFMLFRKPGFVAKNYIEGKRKSYLEPFKMYIFTSTIMFLMLSFFNKMGANHSGDLIKIDLDSKKDSTLASADSMPTPMYYASYEEFEKQVEKSSKREIFLFDRLSLKKMYELGVENNIRGADLRAALGKEMFSKIPQILFFMLPVFAWLLHLLHLKRKELLFSDHGVFTLYFFTTIYITILIEVILAFVIAELFTPKVSRHSSNILGIFLLVHFFIAMKRFYNRSFLRTLGKFLLMFFFGVIVLSIFFLIFLLITLFLF